MTYSEVKHGYQYSHIAAQQVVYKCGSGKYARSRQHKVYHRYYKALGEEYSEHIVAARAYGAEYSDFLLFIGNAGAYEVCEHQRRERCEAYSYPEEVF